MTKLYEIEEISGLYADAFVADIQNDNLLFLSVWGLDTSIQEFLGRLSLPWQQGGIEDINLVLNKDNAEEETDRRWYKINNIKRFQKLTGRSTTKDSLFHHKVHLWFHHELATQVDYVNHRCLLIKQQSEDAEIFSTRLWEAIKTVCPVPLLDEWKHIIDHFQRKGWLHYHEGIQVDAYQLDFSSPDVGSCISSWVRNGLLKLPEEKSKISLVKS